MTCVAGAQHIEISDLHISGLAMFFSAWSNGYAMEIYVADQLVIKKTDIATWDNAMQIFRISGVWCTAAGGEEKNVVAIF